MQFKSFLSQLVTTVALVLPGQVYGQSGASAAPDFFLADRYRVVSTETGPGKKLAARYRLVQEPETTGTHFSRAVEFYAKGPQAAQQILEELDLEIAENPDSISARVLKARTLKGTKRCKEALAVLREVETIVFAKQEISGSAGLLEAECHFFERNYVAAKRALDVYGAFIPETASNKELVAWLHVQLEEKLRPAPTP